MCIKEQVYGELTANPIHSGRYLFEFLNPVDSNRGVFHVMENNSYAFTSDYLVQDDCTIVIKMDSGSDSLNLNMEGYEPKIYIRFEMGYLYIASSDFQHLLSSGRFVVVKN